MAVRLCVQGIGEVSPYKLLKRLTAEDITLYQAWFRQHRFGDDYLHLMLAQLAMIVNNRWRNKTEPARSVKEFIPWYEEPQQSPEEMLAVIREAKSGNRGKH